MKGGTSLLIQIQKTLKLFTKISGSYNTIVVDIVLYIDPTSSTKFCNALITFLEV